MLEFWLGKRGIIQAELARRSGYSTRMISYWCNTEKPMSVEAMYTVAQILGIRMEDLYVWELESSR